jgi:hypothetical protein
MIVKTRHFGRHAGAGALVFLAAQSILFLLARPSGGPTIDSAGWFLNSGQGVLAIAVALVLTAAAIAATSPLPNPWTGVAAFAAGASAMIVVAVLVLGPGTIYPIVIAVGIAIVTLSAVIGASAGLLVRRRLKAGH